MTGINRSTGHRMERSAHIRQSIADILTTPLGTRVMREDYGSLLPELIDRPQNGRLALQLAAASYMAISRWEPRISIQRISTSAPTLDGQHTLDIEAIDIDSRARMSPFPTCGGMNRVSSAG